MKINEGSKPKISIITVCYNSANTIEETILSVINQSYQEIEYIIIDGGSTDGTIDIIKKYEQRISRWISEKDKGIYDAMNKGIKLSTGDLVHFLNSDDYFIDNNIVSEIAKVYSENERPSLIYGNVLCIDPVDNYNFTSGQEIQLKDIKNGIMMPHQGVFANRESLIKCNMFNIQYKIAADYDQISKLIKNNLPSLYINKTIAVFRLGGISSSDALNFQPITEKAISIKENFGVKAYLKYLPRAFGAITRIFIRYGLIKMKILSVWRKIKTS